MKSSSKPQRGRPPAGKGPRGKPVSVAAEYPKIQTRVSPETKAQLSALAGFYQLSEREVLEKAIAEQVNRIPVGDKEAFAVVLRRAKSRSPG